MKTVVRFLAIAAGLLAGCGSPLVQKPRDVMGPIAAVGMHDPRVVFIGDQLLWNMVNSVQAQNPDWINAATKGPETTGSMLARFPKAVVDQHPDIVFILGGSYDVIEDPSWNTGSSPNADTDTITNILAMAALADAAGIKVIVGTLPVQGVTQDTSTQPNFDIMVYNINILSLHVDYFETFPNPLENAGLVDFADTLTFDIDPATGQATWTTDGVTPNMVGDAAMVALVQPVIVGLKVGGVR